MIKEKKKSQALEEISHKSGVQKMKRPKRFFKRIINRKSGSSDSKKKIEDEDSKPNAKDYFSQKDSIQELNETFLSIEPASVEPASVEPAYVEHAIVPNSPIRLLSADDMYNQLLASIDRQPSADTNELVDEHLSSVEQIRSVSNFNDCPSANIESDCILSSHKSDKDEKERCVNINNYINDAHEEVVTSHQPNEKKSKLNEKESRSESLSVKLTTMRNGRDSFKADKLIINPHSEVSNNSLRTAKMCDAYDSIIESLGCGISV